MSDSDFYNFYISYAASDEAWARWVAAVLESAGYRTFVMARDVRAGRNWFQTINDATQKADRTVVLLSSSFLSSSFATEEWQASFASDPTGKRRALLSLRIEPIQSVGLLAMSVSVDLFNVDEIEARSRLLNAATGSRRPTSVQFPGQVSSGEGAGPQRPASSASGKKPGGLDKKNVFISYSHRDRKWLNRLLVHLKPLERTRKLDIWDDSKIKPGTPWKDEIDKALHSSQIAILLISADFLASDFISDNEVPQLLLGAQDRGTIVLPVIVSPSRFKNSENLSAFQAVNSPENPLTRMTAHKREEFFVGIASVVEDTLASFEDVTP